MTPDPRGQGRAPSPPPRVVTVLGLYTLLGLACLPALPVAMATAALLRAQPRLRPWLVALVGATGLAGVVAAGRSPLFGGNLVSFHLSGWAMFSITHPHVDVALWRMLFEAPIGIPLGMLLGAAHMVHSDHVHRAMPWHPRTVQRTAKANVRAGQQVVRVLERMPPFVGDAPALGAVYDGNLAGWQHGPYAVLPRELRGRAITMAGAPGVGKTVLLRRLVSADAARGRMVVFVDGKGTEPRLPAELIAAYTAGAGFAPRVKLWPAEPLSGWQGNGTELANRLLAVQDWSEVWYHRVASRVIRLACSAEIGPPRCAEELLERLTAEGLERLYAGTARAGLVKQVLGAEGFEGAALRYGDFFDALAGKFDGSWSYDDADIAFLRLPVLAAREDSEGAFRLLLEDLGHYGIARKDRDDQGMTIYLDEFSAVSDGARAAIDLAERLRDAGVGVVFVVQSYEGLGDEHQAARLLGSSAAVIVGRMPNPERLLARPGQSGPRSRPGSSTSGDRPGRRRSACSSARRSTRTPCAAPRSAKHGSSPPAAACTSRSRRRRMSLQGRPGSRRPTAKTWPSSRTSGRRGSSTSPSLKRLPHRSSSPASCPHRDPHCRRLPLSYRGSDCSLPRPSARATGTPCRQYGSGPHGSRPSGTSMRSWPHSPPRAANSAATGRRRGGPG